MTNKEATLNLLDILGELHGSIEIDDDLRESVRMAIKALEEEPILDKIRAEIDKARFVDKRTRICKNANASGLEVAMEIIDKYKVERLKNEQKV